MVFLRVLSLFTWNITTKRSKVGTCESENTPKKSNSNICEECNEIPTHHLCTICKKTLACPICLDKRGYDDLNYWPCLSCVLNTKSGSNAKEVTTNEHMSKRPKLDVYANASICTKANSTDSASSLSMQLSTVEV